MVQKPCHNKLPFERDGVDSALIGLETWQARSLGEASRLFHTAAGQSSAVEGRRSTTTVAAAHGTGRHACVAVTTFPATTVHISREIRVAGREKGKQLCPLGLVLLEDGFSYSQCFSVPSSDLAEDA